MIARPDAAELARLYAEHRSSTRLGAILGASGQTVLRWLHQLQIPVRGKGGANNPEGRRGR